MLERLSVSNLAVVEKAEAKFVSTLNVITGETGAGKSVLMGALDLVLGARADSSIVREGAKEAEVEAVFSDGKTIRRTVTTAGKSRAWVNDESVSMVELKELMAGKVDIHGPRANQRLLEEDFQRETLDKYSKRSMRGEGPFKEYSEAYSKWHGLEVERKQLEAEGESADVEYLRFQVDELEAANLSEADETLSERHTAAAHAEEIVETANSIMEEIDGERGVTELLLAIQPKLKAIARRYEGAKAWEEEAEALVIQLQEFSRTIAGTVSSFETGEEDLEELDRRLTLVNKLKRKYGKGTVVELLELLKERRERLEGLEHREERLSKLTEEIAKAERQMKLAGAEVTKVRKEAAAKLEKKVAAELKMLGFLNSGFRIMVEEMTPMPHGMDRVVYLFEPNPGEGEKELRQIASSGEIARVMLAIKSVTEGDGAILVFDEIDANIGGETARIVGERMAAVSKHSQVIAITHLPQSAVFGERHLKVLKKVTNGRTRTKIEEVSGEARISEIARLLGGENITSVVRKHAKEMLSISR